MTKRHLALFLFLTLQSSIILTKPTPLRERKSKEIALIKAIVGSVGTALGLGYGLIGGPGMIFYSYHDQDPTLKIAGCALSAITLPVALASYKMAKSGFDDLQEIAQYPTNCIIEEDYGKKRTDS